MGMQKLKNNKAKTYELISYAFIVILGGFLRFFRLDMPKTLIFDETYYVKDAYSYLISGVETQWDADANSSFIRGIPEGLTDQPAFVVHPPVGKWIIALGIKIFGQESSFGWRFSAAFFGTISIALLIMVAKELFASPLLAGTAGLVLAIDGVHITESRVSLLDIFLCFWLLASFYFLLLDRRQVQSEINEEGLGMRWWRPWRLAVGVTLGLALGTKWSALYFIAVWGLLCVLWDCKLNKKNIRHAPLAFLYLVPTAVITYIISWSGWIQSSLGFDRFWAEKNPGQVVAWLPQWLQSLWDYHKDIYTFHTTLQLDHPYKSAPIGWLLQLRPTAFYYESFIKGQHGCMVEKCSTEITNLGNPLIWWLATASLFLVIYYGFLRQDWKALALLSGVVAGWLPWFFYPERTIYTFYSVVFEPFMILALVYAGKLLLHQESKHDLRRRNGLIAFSTVIILFVVVSAYFYPIWSAEVIPYEAWHARMWFPSWI